MPPEQPRHNPEKAEGEKPVTPATARAIFGMLRQLHDPGTPDDPSFSIKFDPKQEDPTMLASVRYIRLVGEPQPVAVIRYYMIHGTGGRAHTVRSYSYTVDDLDLVAALEGRPDDPFISFDTDTEQDLANTPRTQGERQASKTHAQAATDHIKDLASNAPQLTQAEADELLATLQQRLPPAETPPEANKP